MFEIVKKLNGILNKKQKGSMVIIIIMMLIGAVLETASISIVIPVVTVAMDRKAIEKNELVRALYNILGCQSTESFTVIIMVEYDASGSIGKRYRREDEIGTPFSICVDFETAEDNCVTIRDRDTMEQVRIPVAEVKDYIEERLKF